jgi:hypothetical protein
LVAQFGGTARAAPDRFRSGDALVQELHAVMNKRFGADR